MQICRHLWGVLPTPKAARRNGPPDRWVRVRVRVRVGVGVGVRVRIWVRIWSRVRIKVRIRVGGRPWCALPIPKAARSNVSLPCYWVGIRIRVGVRVRVTGSSVGLIGVILVLFMLPRTRVIN